MLQHSKIFKVWKSVNIFKKWIKDQMSLLSMKITKISLLSKKLFSMKNNFKIFSFSSSENFYFFDFTHLFFAFFSFSVIRFKMHFEFAEFVDSFMKLWHSNVWISSIRTISKQYTQYSNQMFIFSFDFVQHGCEKNDCLCVDSKLTHFDRIIAIEKNYRFSCFQSDALII